MSLVHLKLTQIFQDSIFVEYNVESIDFNDKSLSEKIGTIKIDKSNNDYSFLCSDKHLDKKIIPPTIFYNNDDEQKILIETKYRNFGYGAWSRRLHRWVKSFIDKKEYPSTYPK